MVLKKHLSLDLFQQNSSDFFRNDSSDLSPPPLGFSVLDEASYALADNGNSLGVPVSSFVRIQGHRGGILTNSLEIGNLDLSLGATGVLLFPKEGQPLSLLGGFGANLSLFRALDFSVIYAGGTSNAQLTTEGTTLTFRGRFNPHILQRYRSDADRNKLIGHRAYPHNLLLLELSHTQPVGGVGSTLTQFGVWKSIGLIDDRLILLGGLGAGATSDKQAILTLAARVEVIAERDKKYGTLSGLAECLAYSPLNSPHDGYYKPTVLCGLGGVMATKYGGAFSGEYLVGGNDLGGANTVDHVIMFGWTMFLFGTKTQGKPKPSPLTYTQSTTYRDPYPHRDWRGSTDPKTGKPRVVMYDDYNREMFGIKAGQYYRDPTTQKEYACIGQKCYEFGSHFFQDEKTGELVRVDEKGKTQHVISPNEEPPEFDSNKPKELIRPVDIATQEEHLNERARTYQAPHSQDPASEYDDTQDGSGVNQSLPPESKPAEPRQSRPEPRAETPPAQQRRSGGDTRGGQPPQPVITPADRSPSGKPTFVVGGKPAGQLTPVPNYQPPSTQGGGTTPPPGGGTTPPPGGGTTPPPGGGTTTPPGGGTTTPPGGGTTTPPGGGTTTPPSEEDDDDNNNDRVTPPKPDKPEDVKPEQREDPPRRVAPPPAPPPAAAPSKPAPAKPAAPKPAVTPASAPPPPAPTPPPQPQKCAETTVSAGLQRLFQPTGDPRAVLRSLSGTEKVRLMHEFRSGVCKTYAGVMESRYLDTLVSFEMYGVGSKPDRARFKSGLSEFRRLYRHPELYLNSPAGEIAQDLVKMPEKLRRKVFEGSLGLLGVKERGGSFNYLINLLWDGVDPDTEPGPRAPAFIRGMRRDFDRFFQVSHEKYERIQGRLREIKSGCYNPKTIHKWRREFPDLQAAILQNPLGLEKCKLPNLAGASRGTLDDSNEALPIELLFGDEIKEMDRDQEVLEYVEGGVKLTGTVAAGALMSVGGPAGMASGGGLLLLIQADEVRQTVQAGNAITKAEDAKDAGITSQGTVDLKRMDFNSRLGGLFMNMAVPGVAKALHAPGQAAIRPLIPFLLREAGQGAILASGTGTLRRVLDLRVINNPDMVGILLKGAIIDAAFGAAGGALGGGAGRGLEQYRNARVELLIPPGAQLKDGNFGVLLNGQPLNNTWKVVGVDPLRNLLIVETDLNGAKIRVSVNITEAEQIQLERNSPSYVAMREQVIAQRMAEPVSVSQVFGNQVVQRIAGGKPVHEVNYQTPSMVEAIHAGEALALRRDIPQGDIVALSLNSNHQKIVVMDTFENLSRPGMVTAIFLDGKRAGNQLTFRVTNQRGRTEVDLHWIGVEGSTQNRGMGNAVMEGFARHVGEYYPGARVRAQAVNLKVPGLIDKNFEEARVMEIPPPGPGSYYPIDTKLSPVFLQQLQNLGALEGGVAQRLIQEVSGRTDRPYWQVHNDFARALREGYAKAKDQKKTEANNEVGYLAELIKKNPELFKDREYWGDLYIEARVPSGDSLRTPGGALRRAGSALKN